MKDVARIEIHPLARLILGELAHRRDQPEGVLLSDLLLRAAANELVRETYTEHKSPVPDSEQGA